jgi:RHS repeat-associated protein
VFTGSVTQQQFEQWKEPFTIVPHWNMRGQPDNGTSASGSLVFGCGGGTPPGGGSSSGRCAVVLFPYGWTAYWQKMYRQPVWHGTFLDEKRDGSQLIFKRARYYDPATGRFTQEDPIGLAGGLNLYGFASGDPVNYSDPFGLCPNPLATGLGSLQCAIEDIIAAIKSGPSMLAEFGRDPLKGGFALKLAMVPLTVVDGAGDVEGIANAIGKGHAFAKHVLEHGRGGGEFVGLGIRTVKQFQRFVGEVIEGASGANVRSLSRGRTAYWDDATGTVVIHDPRSPDLGTAFRPKDGRSYFEGLK